MKFFLNEIFKDQNFTNFIWGVDKDKYGTSLKDYKRLLTWRNFQEQIISNYEIWIDTE